MADYYRAPFGAVDLSVCLTDSTMFSNLSKNGFVRGRRKICQTPQLPIV